MKKLLTLTLLVTAAMLFALTLNCGDDDDDDDDDDMTLNFDPEDFQTTVDNEYFPLTPGTVKTFEGDDGEDDLKVVTTVLAETENVAGVDCTVLNCTKKAKCR